MKKEPKTPKIFSCENCDYTCNKQSDWNRHLLTTKHKNRTFRTKKEPKNADANFFCKCGKSYKARNSLWYHRQKCGFTHVEEKNEKNEKNEKIKKNEKNENYKEIFVELIKENKEMRKTIENMIPVIGNTINTTNNNNTINSININLFLNDQCKDALNLMDFVNSLQVQLEDIKNTGKLGFVEGTSKIFINGLKELELHKRPIHCSDLKKEILYIKDNDIWEKETADKNIMKKAIDEINNTNIKNMSAWVEENPEYLENNESNNNDYMNIISKIIGTNLEKEKEDIISNVAKEVLLNDPIIINNNK